jgi:hypothetical protein
LYPYVEEIEMRFLRTLLMLCMLVSMSLANTLAVQVEPESYTFGIEINEVLCGYADVQISTIKKENQELTLIKEKVFVMLSALGHEFNMNIKNIYHIDPATGRFIYHICLSDSEEMETGYAVLLEDDALRFTFALDDKESRIELSPDIILENSQFFPHLMRDFIDGDTAKKSYEIFEPRAAEIQKSTYTKVGIETLELAGKRYETVIIEKLNLATAAKTRMWVNTDDGHRVKASFPNGRVTYLADHSIKKRIQLASLDPSLTTKVGVLISDVRAISLMKVKATIEPTGLLLNEEDLSVPGQRFEGTVKNNVINGVFEIEHRRYDGTNAPPYPTNFGDDESLRKYLEPQQLIESDDPVLAKKAQELAEGSQDSWEAACRLSQWVADNIDYKIPGGGTARKTYDIRAGECGAHSLLLAAFCRGVEIPARVVWGCMYFPNYGGSFGQHAWTEIYMGEAGWIPVDSTAFESSYIDSGHIRLGIYQSFASALNAKAMKILDYRIGSGGKDGPGAAVSGKYALYVGEYENPRGGDLLKVIVRNGYLALDIPDLMVLPFNDPNENGIWYCTLSRNVFLTFSRNRGGKVVELKFHEIERMRRNSEPETINSDVPENLQPYLGGYYLPDLQVEFVVFWDKGGFAVNDPLQKAVVHLEPSDEKGVWIYESGNNTISFATNDDGKVLALILDDVKSCPRR